MVINFAYNFYKLGCAFVTFMYQQAAQLAVNTLHDKVKLPNVSLANVIYFFIFADLIIFTV